MKTTTAPTNTATVKLSASGIPALHVIVHSLEEASREVCGFLDEHLLGMRDWTGGELRVGRKIIGYISYNGRAWHGLPQHWTPDTAEMTDAEFAQLVADGELKISRATKRAA